MVSLEELDYMLSEGMVGYDFRKMISQNKGDGHLFRKAAEEGHFFVVRFFLDAKQHFRMSREEVARCTNTGAADSEGTTPLHLAASNGHARVVNLLIAHATQENSLETLSLHTFLQRVFSEPPGESIDEIKGVEYDVATDDNMAAVSIREYDEVGRHENVSANESCLYDRTKRWIGPQPSVLDLNTIVSPRDIYMRTPLHLAARNGHFHIVRLLLRLGACSSDTDGPMAETALHYAVRGQHLSVVEFLLSANAEVNIKNKCHDTPVDVAFNAGYRSIALVLLNHGGALNKNKMLSSAIKNRRFLSTLACLKIGADLSTNTVTTPLHDALKWRNFDLARFLIENKAYVNARDKMGNTPLHVAVLQQRAEWVTKLLIDQGALIDAVNHKGLTPLQCARCFSHLKILIANGADPNVVDHDGRTLLHSATDINVVRLLLDSGAQFNAKDSVGNTPLHFACLKANIPVAELLINRGAQVNEENNIGYPPLVGLVFVYCSDLIKLLVGSGAEVYPDITNWRGETLLHLASSYGDLEIAELLLEKGFPVNEMDFEENTPLHIAVDTCNHALAQLLISHGALVNTRNDMGYSPLAGHTFAYHSDFIKLLIESGAEVRDITNWRGETFLQLACLNDDLEIAKLLLVKGSHVNVMDSDGDTPLHKAVNLCNNNIARLLIDHGADVNYKNNAFQAPLHFVSSKTEIEIIELLLKNGAYPSVRDLEGDTPLHNAVKSRNITIVQSLIDHNANVNAKNNEGIAPLHIVCPTGEREIAQLLLRKGADPSVRDLEGNTPLHNAVKSRNTAFAQLLIEHSANVNAKNNVGIAPLHIVCPTGEREIAELLLSNGADLSVRDSTGDTPLHKAVDSRNGTIAQLLVENGADVNTANNNGVAPLHLICPTKEREIAELLLQNGADPSVFLEVWDQANKFFVSVLGNLFSGYNSQLSYCKRCVKSSPFAYKSMKQRLLES